MCGADGNGGDRPGEDVADLRATDSAGGADLRLAAHQ